MSNTKSVLIVEDNKAINDMFSRYLSRVGLQVQSALGVKDALKSLNSNNPPALVILDLGLEDGDSSDILDCLRTRENIKTIIVSGRLYGANDGLSSYHVDYTLLKPVSPSGLAALAKSVL